MTPSTMPGRASAERQGLWLARVWKTGMDLRTESAAADRRAHNLARHHQRFALLAELACAVASPVVLNAVDLSKSRARWASWNGRLVSALGYGFRAQTQVLRDVYFRMPQIRQTPYDDHPARRSSPPRFRRARRPLWNWRSTPFRRCPQHAMRCVCALICNTCALCDTCYNPVHICNNPHT